MYANLISIFLQALPVNFHINSRQILRW